jgi:hypothetical protein
MVYLIRKKIMEELRKYIDSITKYYNYKSLDKVTSKSVRRYYNEAIPEYLNINGDSVQLMDKYGTTICKKYDRIVIGDYGPYIEFSEEDIYPQNFRVKKGEEYRSSERYKNCKYLWLTTKNERQDVKIYLQKHKVSYADYIPGKYYVCIDQAFPKSVIYEKNSRKRKKEKRLLENTTKCC